MEIAVCSNIKYDLSLINQLIKDCSPDNDIAFNVSTFSNYYTFYRNIKKQKYDLIYFNIEEYPMIGFKLLEYIQNKYPRCMIILLTETSQYLIKAFHIQALQYYVRPINQKFFKKDLERAVEKYKDQHYRLCLKSHYNTYFCIDVYDIMYIETYYDKFIIHTDKQKYYAVDKSIQKTRLILLEKNFIQVSKSYIVNANHIDFICEQYIILKNRTIIKISNNYTNEFNRRYTKYLNYSKRRLKV